MHTRRMTFMLLKQQTSIKRDFDMSRLQTSVYAFALCIVARVEIRHLSFALLRRFRVGTTYYIFAERRFVI